MMTLVVVTVSVAVLMAGVPSAAQGKDTGVSLKEYHKQLDIFKKAFHDQHRDFEKLREQLLSQDALLDNQRSLIQRLDKKVSTIKGDLSKEKNEREKSDQTEKEIRRQSAAQIQGDLSEEKTIREQSDQTIRGRVDTLENTVVLSCSQDSDCTAPLYFCRHGWCSIAECSENSHCQGDIPACDTITGRCYQYDPKSYCGGSKIGTSWGTLDAAVSACSSNHECGCIRDPRANWSIFQIYKGTALIEDHQPNTEPNRAWVKKQVTGGATNSLSSG